MKITALEVEGFGVWTGLRLDGLDDGLNVFFGPNEAGKTTLMQFVRAVLYGWTPQRRRYLPPRHGGAAGGWLWIRGPQGEFRVGRFDRSSQGGPDDEVQVIGADGFQHGPAILPALLCNIDEAIFNNVFAVGLEELQELATLNDTQAAALLYNLSVGLDRVSLIDVVRELRGSRNRLIDANGGPCQVAQWLAERDRLQAEIEHLGSLGARYARLASERDQVDRETAQLEEENRQLARQLRIVEIGQSIRPRLEKRRMVEEQLALLGKVDAFPEGDVPRLDRINEAIEKRQRQWEELLHEFQRLRREAEAEKVDAAVLRQAPRIEALAEQEDWIRSLEDRVLELESEIAAGENEWKTHCDRLRLPEGSLPAFSPRALAALRPVAREMRRCVERLEELRAQAAAGEEAQQSLAARLQSSLDARGEKQLSAATERLSGLVAQLRRRLQLDQRLSQMQRLREELEDQRRALLDQQMLPGWILTALGGLFIAGILLVLLTIWNVFSPTSLVGSLGWPMASFGLVFTGVSIVLKLFLERANARRLEECQTQLRAVRAQIKQTEEERESLDRQLPRAPGSLEARLQAAERELAALEELAPLDAQRETARQQSEAIAVRLKEAEADLANARRRWEEAVAAAGFPKGVSPKQVRQLASHAGEIKELHERIQRRREELEHRSAELESLTTRIAQLVEDLQVKDAGRSPAERLRALVERLRAEEARWKRRQELLRQARQMRPKRLRAKLGLVRLKRLKRLLLDRAGAADEVEFRRRAADQARAMELRAQRDAVQREIDAALGGYCTEDEVRQQVDDPHGPSLEIRREQLQKRLEACAAQLKQRYEHRGQLAEQIKGLAENRAPVVKRLELAMVEKRLDDAIRRWQVLALTHQVLENVRKTYERTRQPETLQEASAYLERMTQGRYRRVWTPLDEDVLVLDDEEQRAFSVETLSRGTREQLFLCLRLALAASYARRGAHLPLVLDDVLVNFDTQRAKAAAGVLRDFAQAGHQLLVFTCHEHIARMFQTLRVEIHELPEQGRGRSAVPAPRKTPSRPPRKRPAEEPPAELVAVEDPAPAETVAEPVAEPPAPPSPPVECPPPPPLMEALPPWEADDSEPAAPILAPSGEGPARRPAVPDPLEGRPSPFDERPDLVRFFEEPDAEDAEAA